MRDINGAEQQITGSPFASGASIAISTQDLANKARSSINPGYGYSFVRIYDTNALNGGTPTDTIGDVTITADSAVPTQIRLLVAPPPISGINGHEDFLPRPDFRIDFPGAKHFRSLNVTGTLPQIVRLAAAITGDFGDPTHTSPRDLIHVSQVYRLQTSGVLDGSGNITSGGNIFADVKAEMNSDKSTSGNFGPLQDAVSFVWAGQSIQGTIEATGGLAEGFQPRNSINQVFCGINPIRTGGAVVGITGDLKAEFGGIIRSVLCNGPIGTATRNSRFRAGNGILEVRCVQLDSNGSYSTPAEESIRADIVANLDYTPTGNPLVDAPINYIQTDGNLSGSIAAANIPVAGNLSGILVRGVVDAPITIDFNLENASILGASFEQPIWIGVKAKGCIVATDAESGTIAQLEIGFEDSTHVSYASFPHGMTGIDCPPVLPDRAAPLDELTADDFFAVAACTDGGTPDSLVRARTIGTLRINSMSTRFFAGNDVRKQYVPRVEAEVIDHLVIGELREGVVWSGLLEALGDGTVDNDPTNDYAAIGTLQIGVVGPYSDIWFKDCAKPTFTGNVLGELHLPSLAIGQAILIHGRLETYAACSCAEFHPDTCPFPTPSGSQPEVSPRWTDCAQPAAIRLRDEMSLAGQVVLNAGNTEIDPADAWTGGVVIGETATTPIVLAPGSASPHTAPYYQTSSAMLGGGAVGLAPFHLHGQDCDPPHDPDGAGGGMLSDHLNDEGQVRATFYGPIRRKNAHQTWAQHVRIHGRPFTTGTMTPAISPTSTATTASRCRTSSTS